MKDIHKLSDGSNSLLAANLLKIYRQSYASAITTQPSQNEIALEQTRLFRSSMNEYFISEINNIERTAIDLDPLIPQRYPIETLKKRIVHLAKFGVSVISIQPRENQTYDLTYEGMTQVQWIFGKLGLTDVSMESIYSHIGGCISRNIESMLDTDIPASLIIRKSENLMVSVPVDIVLASQPAQSSSILARCISREDWLTLCEQSMIRKISEEFSISFPIATFSLWASDPEGSSNDHSSDFSQWVLTPNASWSDEILNYLYEKMSFGHQISLRFPNEEWIPIERIQLRNQALRHGIYLEARNPTDIESLCRKHYTTEIRGMPSSHWVNKYIVNAELFWNQNTTHLVAPTTSSDINRIAYSIPDAQMPKIYEDIANNGYIAQLPFIETKTSIYRYFADIDLPWHLYQTCTAFLELKHAQLAYFDDGSNSKTFKTLNEIIDNLYPKAGTETKIARRSGHVNEIDKYDGFHIIYPELLIPNDGRTGQILTGQIELLAASSIDKEGMSPLARFLLFALIEDHTHLGNKICPLSFIVSQHVIAKTPNAQSIAEFINLSCAGVRFSIPNQQIALSQQDSGELLRFAIGSIKTESLEHYFNQVTQAPTPKQSKAELLKFIGRCRWEVLRRARFFDHAVYGVTIGLRMIGTEKPDDKSSIYLPLNHLAQLTPDLISEFSIRTSATSLSEPSYLHTQLLSSLSIEFGSRSSIARSLDGIFMSGHLHQQINVMGLTFELKIDSKEAKSPSTKIKVESISSSRFIAPDAPPQIIEVDLEKNPVIKNHGPYKASPLGHNRFFQALAHPTEGNLKIYPPTASFTRNLPSFLHQKSGTQDRIIRIRVRVFIPSPVVEGPPGLNNFGGDGRGPSYDQGTSRLDIDIEFNPRTKAIQYHWQWGETTEYDPDDTYKVSGKPDWWFDKSINAQPIDRATLAKDSRQVRAYFSGTNKLTISYSGGNPLVSLSPDIDGRFAIFFLNDGRISIQAQHDGFPYHSLYIDGNFVYGYDPESEGTSPYSLFGNSDVERTTPPQSIGTPPLPSTGSNPTGGSTYEVPLDIKTNDDGTVTIGESANTDMSVPQETFEYNDTAQGWAGDKGSTIDGREDLFETISDDLSTATVRTYPDGTTTYQEICSSSFCIGVTPLQDYP